jgi:hypothetical protein
MDMRHSHFGASAAPTCTVILLSGIPPIIANKDMTCSCAARPQRGGKSRPPLLLTRTTRSPGTMSSMWILHSALSMDVYIGHSEFTNA